MKKRITIGLIFVIIICLFAWRFWPHSLSNLLPLSQDIITGVSGYANISDVQNGKAFIDSYEIAHNAVKDGELQEILMILDSSDYQQDFRNILPWSIDQVDAGKNFEGYTVNLVFTWGDETNASVNMMFLSKNIVVVDTGTESGFRIYHPVNKDVLGNLVEYLKVHGARK